MSSKNRDHYLTDLNLTPLERYDVQNGTGRAGAWTLVRWVKFLIGKNRELRKEVETLKREMAEIKYHVYHGAETTETPFMPTVPPEAEEQYRGFSPVRRNATTGYPE